MTMEPWTFGEAPLPAVVELAEVVRELTSTVLSLERTSPRGRALPSPASPPSDRRNVFTPTIGSAPECLRSS